MYDCGLFEANFIEEWEALTGQTWAPTISVFTKEYGIVTRATNHEAQRSKYDSTSALCKRPDAKTSTTTSEYKSMSKYDAASEEQVTALQTAADNESLAAGQTVVSNFAASATTVHSKNFTLIKEFQAKRKEQVAQMKRLTALVNYIASKSDRPPEDPTRDWHRGDNQNNNKTRT